MGEAGKTKDLHLKFDLVLRGRQGNLLNLRSSSAYGQRLKIPRKDPKIPRKDPKIHRGLLFIFSNGFGWVGKFCFSLIDSQFFSAVVGASNFGGLNFYREA